MEFNIIRKYFASQPIHREDVIHGIGDDAAVLKVPDDQELVVTTDTLVSGVHFFEDTKPADIGYKSLAVNLSDLAAMGANPAWFMLALTMPYASDTWLYEFCEGMYGLSKQYNVQLIGGNLAHGPLSITIEALGFVPKGAAILRRTAKPNDAIYVTGTLGDSGFALAQLKSQKELPAHFANQLNRPQPRLAAGMALRNHAHAAIDISDGLIADLNHILEASNVGAVINVDHLPLSQELTQHVSREDAIQFALTSGDDYELCFTIPDSNRKQVENLFREMHCRITCIGKIFAEQKLLLQYENGESYDGAQSGYEHF